MVRAGDGICQHRRLIGLEVGHGDHAGERPEHLVSQTPGIVDPERPRRPAAVLCAAQAGPARAAREERVEDDRGARGKPWRLALDE